MIMWRSRSMFEGRLSLPRTQVKIHARADFSHAGPRLELFVIAPKQSRNRAANKNWIASLRSQ
jgi:hypothetical protein